MISGKLQAQPSEKLAKTGKPSVTAKVRVHAGEADVFVNVMAFSESACTALLALDSGDAVALAGSLTPNAWTDLEGVVRPALDLVAQARCSPPTMWPASARWSSPGIRTRVRPSRPADAMASTMAVRWTFDKRYGLVLTGSFFRRPRP